MDILFNLCSSWCYKSSNNRKQQCYWFRDFIDDC